MSAFGSEADICAAITDVRFAPESRDMCAVGARPVIGEIEALLDD
jgi:hypothetical protein